MVQYSSIDRLCNAVMNVRASLSLLVLQGPAHNGSIKSALNLYSSASVGLNVVSSIINPYSKISTKCSVLLSKCSSLTFYMLTHWDLMPVVLMWFVATLLLALFFILFCTHHTFEAQTGLDFDIFYFDQELNASILSASFIFFTSSGWSSTRPAAGWVFSLALVSPCAAVPLDHHTELFNLYNKWLSHPGFLYCVTITTLRFEEVL